MTLDERRARLATVRARLATLKADVPDPTNHGDALARALDDADGALDRRRPLWLDRAGQ
jgi:hypothetical protein